MVWASKCAWVLALWLSLAMLHGVGAQVGAPSPSMDCTSALLSLADCLTFVVQGSKLTKPQGQCCSGFKKVAKEEVACLCEAFKGSANFGVSLNMTKALTLPSACGVSTPPFSKCKIAGLPGAAPARIGCDQPQRVPFNCPPCRYTWSHTWCSAQASGNLPTVEAPSPSSGAPSSSGSASTMPTPSPRQSGAPALSAPSFVVVLAAAAVALFQSI